MIIFSIHFPFRNARACKATGRSKIEASFSPTFFTPEKLGKGWAKSPSYGFELRRGPTSDIVMARGLSVRPARFNTTARPLFWGGAIFCPSFSGLS